MTTQELDAEYWYRFNERIGIMCGDRDPTPEQETQAHAEAAAAIQELKAQSKPKKETQQFFADTCKSDEDVMKAQAGLSALLKLRDSL